jgi:hypothetical protein
MVKIKRDMTIHTLDLLETFLVETADLDVLLSKHLQTSDERVSDLEVIVVLMRSAWFRAIQRRFHLSNRRHDLLSLLDQVFPLSRDQSHLIVQGL